MGNNSKIKTGRSKTAPARWIKSGFKQPLTSNLFTSKYFWINNSDEIATMINDCLNSLVTPNMLIMIKEGDRWSILINADHYDELEGVYFNDNMKRYFSFDYSDDGLNKITTSKFKTININDVQYFAITTPNTNNKMFPFDRVVFKSEKLPVFQLLVQNYDDTIFNSTSSIIMSYDLAVNDISEITTSMSYINTSRDRSLSLNDNKLPDYFTIECFLVTPSGYEHRLKLRPTEKISLSLMFY